MFSWKRLKFNWNYQQNLKENINFDMTCKYWVEEILYLLKFACLPASTGLSGPVLVV